MAETDLAAFFLRNGYLRVPGALPSDLVEELQTVLDREFEAARPPVRVNSAGQLSRIDGLIDRDPIFLRALRHEHVSGALKALLGPDIELVRDRHNQATLNRRGDIPFRLHRDV